MSFSNPTPVTPVKRTFKWAGSKGDLTWYDLDTKERNAVKKPFRFIVLDQLNAITGYSKELEGGIWSNEVRNLKQDQLYAKVGKMQIAGGLYEHIKDAAKSKGGKYTRATYVLFEDADKQWTVGKIMIAGSALGAWFDFVKANSTDEVGVSLVGATEEENGSTKFFAPVFDPFELTEALTKQAVEADKKVQAYLEKYANAKPDAHEEPGNDEPAPADDYDLDKSDEPVDLSEIPF